MELGNLLEYGNLVENRFTECKIGLGSLSLILNQFLEVRVFTISINSLNNFILIHCKAEVGRQLT